MAVEIERKFLVTGSPWEQVPGRRLVQGYLAEQGGVSVRIRLDGGQGILGVKGPTRGTSRVEVEVGVPLAEAEALLALCGTRVVAKHRHLFPFGDHTWEIDVFEGENLGLVVAEVELGSEEEAPLLPPWVGREVTHDPAYTNLRLAERPFRTWSPS